MEREPIFNSILQNMVLGYAVNLKKKARIRIKNAAVLIGVIDEKGILEENEVYVKINRGSYDYDFTYEGVISKSDKIVNYKGEQTNAKLLHIYDDE